MNEPGATLCCEPGSARPPSMKTLPSRSESLLTILLAVLAAALCAACGGGGSKPGRHATRGDERFAAGDYNSAEIEYKNLVREQPGNAHALRRLGIIWHERGSPVRAVGFLMQSKERDSGNDALRIELAEVLHTLGEQAAARKEAMVVLERTPGHSDALVTLALTASTAAEVEDTARRTGDWKAAVVFNCGVTADGTTPIRLYPSEYSARKNAERDLQVIK